MSEDKRPKPTLDLRPEKSTTPRALTREDLGDGSQRSKQILKHHKPSLAGYIVAGLFGGFVVAGVVLLAINEQIPGFSIADQDVRRDLRVLQDRTALLDKAIASQNRNGSPSGGKVLDDQTINELRARLDGIVQNMRTLDQSLQGLSERITTAEKRIDGASLKSLEAEITRQISPLSNRVAAAEQILETLNKAQNERQVEARSAALTLALTNLKRAIADGRPFQTELAAVETISTTKLPIAQLSVYKDTGIPTMIALQREFETSSKQAITRHYRTSNNTIVGEVLSRAKSAIQVKSADNSGATVEAVLGRIEASLQKEDLRTALAEGESLKGAAAEELRPWLVRLNARLTSDETLRKTDQELLAALAKPLNRRQ